MRRVLFVVAAVAALTFASVGLGTGGGGRPPPTVDPDTIVVDETTTVTVSGEECIFVFPAGEESSEPQGELGVPGIVEIQIIPPSGPPPIATGGGPANPDGTWSFDLEVTPDEVGDHDVEASCEPEEGVNGEAGGERSPQQQAGFSYPTVTLSVIAGDDTEPADPREREPTFTG